MNRLGYSISLEISWLTRAIKYLKDGLFFRLPWMFQGYRKYYATIKNCQKYSRFNSKEVPTTMPGLHILRTASKLNLLFYILFTT